MVIDDDDEEEIPTPTVESRVLVVGRKRIYSLIDESESLLVLTPTVACYNILQ